MQFYRSASPIRLMLVDCIANTDNLSWTISFLVWMASRSLLIGRYKKALRTASGFLFLVPLSFIVKCTTSFSPPLASTTANEFYY